MTALSSPRESKADRVRDLQISCTALCQYLHGAARRRRWLDCALADRWTFLTKALPTTNSLASRSARGRQIIHAQGAVQRAKFRHL